MVLIKWNWPDLNYTGPDTTVMFIQLALCFDYALFFWARFSLERQKNPQQSAYLDAIIHTLQTSGFVILLSMSVMLVTFFIGCLYPDLNKTGWLGQYFKCIAGVLSVAFYSLAVPAVLAALFPSVYDEPEKLDGCCG